MSFEQGILKQIVNLGADPCRTHLPNGWPLPLSLETQIDIEITHLQFYPSGYLDISSMYFSVSSQALFVSHNSVFQICRGKKNLTHQSPGNPSNMGPLLFFKIGNRYIISVHTHYLHILEMC